MSDGQPDRTKRVNSLLNASFLVCSFVPLVLRELVHAGLLIGLLFVLDMTEKES